MKNLKKQFATVLALVLALPFSSALAQEDNLKSTGFVLTGQAHLQDYNADAYYYKHGKTGAEVVYLDNQSQRREFSIGFKTPPADNKGANHVLEHSLLCGSEKYPTPKLMYYVRGNALAEDINATTLEDCTYYSIKTKNETEYYNLIDVYMNGILHPLLLKEKNIFRQQGIRKEYIDGKVHYNGVVYNELQLNNQESTENSINFLSDKLYTGLYGDTTPSLNSGGTISALKTLTYEDVLNVYNAYYHPSNSMIYLSGTQDIQSTLSRLNEYFNGFDKQNISVSFQDTKQMPEQQTLEYNITPATKTVDIGFMSSGVMMRDQKELYARNIIFNMISKELNALHANSYVSGGNAGGISNLALMAAQVPVEKKNEIIDAYEAVLQRFAANGFDQATLETAIDENLSQRKDPYTYPPEQMIFNGILYGNDPFYYMDPTQLSDSLKQDPAFFQTILKKYYTQNPYRITVVSGNGAKTPEPDSLDVTDAQLEQIKQDTEAFNTWVNMPDDPAVIDKIPSLTPDAVEKSPVYYEAEKETVGKIDYFPIITDGRERDTAALYFPLNAAVENLSTLQLLCTVLTNQAQKAQLRGVYFDLPGLEQYGDPSSIAPHLCIGISAESGKLESTLQALFSFLENDSIWNEIDFNNYIDSAAEEILTNGYRDPYFLSYNLMLSGGSSGKRFGAATRGSIGEGGVPYYQFLKQAKHTPVQNKQLLESLHPLLDALVFQNIPTVEYIGGEEGYEVLKAATQVQFSSAIALDPRSDYRLPAGCPSAATITNIEDSNHFMLASSFDASKDYGKLQVLSSVLKTKYLLPVMRGQHGAYGAGMYIDESSIVCSVAGLANIDMAISIWQGMGDFLRTLNMTQKELDGIIVSAVNDFDQYNESENGAYLALMGKTTHDLTDSRDQMLRTSVDDIKILPI